ncbi:MAG: nucleoside deaminase [Ruminococcaceae bacterium]|nr:nucleoside deaminase [Oscillospiraceae bacterium]
MEHEVFMKRALDLAKMAGDMGEIPVGALVVKDGKIIGEGHNLREQNRIATAHAEVIAIEEACKRLGGWRLSGCTLYVTLEPCPMCAGAIVNSRIEKLVYALDDPRAGCYGSVLNFNSYPFNHSCDVESGVCAEESAELLKEFFKKKR